MHIEKSISLDQLYYLDDETLIKKIKEHLKFNEKKELDDLEKTPELVQLINDFFSDKENIDLFLKSTSKGFFTFNTPSEIIFCGVNSDGKYLNGITFYLKYKLPDTFEEQIEKFKQKNTDFFKKEFKNRGSYTADNISNNRISLIYSGYFKGSHDQNIKMIEYCNSNRYYYEIKIKNEEIRYKITMVIKNEY